MSARCPVDGCFYDAGTACTMSGCPGRSFRNLNRPGDMPAGFDLIENTAGRDANRLAAAGSVSSFHHGGTCAR